MSLVRSILALTRTSSLPTVWSNCLAGWWLGGGGHTEYLPAVFGSATLLFLGGSFLKDAFDVDFDRQHRPSRPIPAGRFSETSVYRLGLGFLTCGALLLLWPGHVTGILGLSLVCCIILHNTTHRNLPLAPVLRGICRLLLYLLGASVAARGIGGWAIWCGIALAAYTAGLGYLAAGPAKIAPSRSWPILLLATPVALALIMDAGEYRESGLLLSLILSLWAIRCLWQAFRSPGPDLARGVSGLTAAIVFVDWLATCPLNLSGLAGEGPRQLGFAFLVLFGATLLLQKLERTNKSGGS